LGNSIVRVLAASLSVVLIGACGSSSHSSSTSTNALRPTRNLNTKRVAVAIEQSIMSARHLQANVVCPGRIPQGKGRTFTCTATTSTTQNHQRVPVHTNFTVFQKDNAGNVYYQSPK
jgi:hypothetical protein